MTWARVVFWWCVLLVVRAYVVLARRPHFVIKLDGSPYVTRYYLTGKRRDVLAALARGETGNPGTYLHHFHREDADRRLHNHPNEWNRTRVLRGGYTELRAYTADDTPIVFEYRAGDTARLTPDRWHRVAALHGDTWTLFSAGPKHGRGWGFRPAFTHPVYRGGDWDFVEPIVAAKSLKKRRRT